MSQETHERFKKNLKSSEPAVRAVHKYLLGRVFNAVAPSLHVPETFDEGIADSGDIIVPVGEMTYRIEVKLSKKHLWEDLVKFKPGIIIDKKSTWDAKTPKPDAYYIVDKSVAFAGVFDCKQWDRVFTKKYPDQVTGVMEPCYVAEVDLFRTVSLK